MEYNSIFKHNGEFIKDLSGHKNKINSLLLIEPNSLGSISNDGTLRIWIPDVIFIFRAKHVHVCMTLEFR